MAKRPQPLPADTARASWNGRALTARGRLDPERAWSLLADAAAATRIATGSDHVQVKVTATRKGTAAAYVLPGQRHAINEAMAKAVTLVATHCLPWQDDGAIDHHWALDRRPPGSASVRAIEAADRAAACQPHLDRLTAYLKERGRGNLARRIETMAKEACA